MTVDRDELRGKLAAAGVPNGWTYRPDAYDDWGVIRGAPHLTMSNGRVVAVARSHREYDGDEHRRAGTDPFRANGELITAAVNALPALLSDADAKDARIAELEAALRPFAGLSVRDDVPASRHLPFEHAAGDYRRARAALNNGASHE